MKQRMSRQREKRKKGRRKKKDEREREGGKKEGRESGRKKRKLKVAPDCIERIIYNIGIQRKKSLHEVNKQTKTPREVKLK